MYRAKGGAYWKKVIKGEWGMPRLLEAKKDVVSCEKLRGFANEILSADIRMGQPGWQEASHTVRWANPLN